MLKILKPCHCLLLLLISLSACTSQELKDFGKDVAHNVHCDHQYENMHKQATLRDNCLNERP